jgi:hypothetical protein
MALGLRLNGKIIGVEPNTGPSFPVYTNRDSIGGWEEVTLTPHDNGTFDVIFVAANRQLSITPPGKLESRPIGAVGGWETFYATTQPEGVNFLYRYEGNTLVNLLLLEEQ